MKQFLRKWLPEPVQARVRVWRAKARRLRIPGSVRSAPPEVFVKASYQIMLRRDADPDGLANYVNHLERGTLTQDGVLDEMLTSMELREIPYRNLLRSQHQSRCDFVRLLPRAARILDLGGTDQADDHGALVSMGYPYRFERLVIIDLPSDERHELYGYRASSDAITTPLGPVEYRYHSMVDLSEYPDTSFDLVFSGQTIEHITEDEARKMLGEVRRVLEPGGWFCVDTPNVRATNLMNPDGTLSNPDHKIEYTIASLTELVRDAGFEVTASYGLNDLGDCFERGVWDDAVAAARHGVFSDADNCVLIALVCRNPQ
jgi:predicted SAM-dependent methyltransferase